MASQIVDRHGGIIEIAERYPAGHEMEIGPVAFAGRKCCVAHDLISGLVFVLIEQLASENAPLAPPLVGVLQRHRFRRRRHDQAGGFIKPVMTHHPVNAAQRIAQILAGLGCDRIEQIECLLLIALDRLARLHDRFIRDHADQPVFLVQRPDIRESALAIVRAHLQELLAFKP